MTHTLQETKYTRLERLREIVSVPAFVYVRRGDALRREELPRGDRYIVRGVSAREDGAHASHAGQFVTIGPCAAADVPGAVADIFTRPEALGVIVQVFAEGPGGVAFCFARDTIYVEYAHVHEGVTAGTVQPSVALLPSDVVRYDALTRALQRIYDAFGPCDVEFVGVEDPAFVQVRPITRTFAVDRDVVRCKMALQEIAPSRWVQNDLAETIAQHGDDADRFWSVYRRAMARFFNEVLGTAWDVPHGGVVRIGRQYFVRQDVVDAQRLTAWRMVKFLWYYARHADVLRAVGDDDTPTDMVMMRNYCVAIAYALWRRKELFALRERYRAVIDARLSRCVCDAQPIRALPCPYPLASPVVYDRRQLRWVAYAPRTGAGEVVVDGDFAHGPYFCYTPGARIPDGVIVLTPYLYAAIGSALPRIRGIICTYGSWNAHVAILAREQNVPLMINADLSRCGECSERVRLHEEASEKFIR